MFLFQNLLSLQSFSENWIAERSATLKNVHSRNLWKINLELKSERWFSNQKNVYLSTWWLIYLQNYFFCFKIWLLNQFFKLVLKQFINQFMVKKWIQFVTSFQSRFFFANKIFESFTVIFSFQFITHDLKNTQKSFK